MNDVVEIYFKDLSKKVQKQILNFGTGVSKEMLKNAIPITYIMREDVSDYLDDEFEEYDDEFSCYNVDSCDRICYDCIADCDYRDAEYLEFYDRF